MAFRLDKPLVSVTNLSFFISSHFFRLTHSFVIRLLYYYS